MDYFISFFCSILELSFSDEFTLISNISLFHSLGFPILIGISRKKFIKNLSGINDSTERIGGTISSALFGMLQGVQMYRVHDVNEINQSIKVFKILQFN